MTIPFPWVLAWLRLSQRRTLYASEASVRAGVAAARRRGPALPGRGLRRALHIEESVFQGHRVFHLRPRQRQQQQQPPAAPFTLLYLHGGGYVFPITSHHWQLVHDLVLHTGCEAVVPLYPLAPESTCVATQAWARSLYGAVATPERPVVLAGDSAGAGLALALAHGLRDADTDGVPPARLLLITPAVDWALDGDDVTAIAPHDPMLMRGGVAAAARLYAGDLALADARISPLGAVHAGLPPTLVLTAGRDILAPSGQALAAHMEAQGVTVRLWHAPTMIHVWPVLPVPEGRAVRLQLAQWLVAD